MNLMSLSSGVEAAIGPRPLVIRRTALGDAAVRHLISLGDISSSDRSVPRPRFHYGFAQVLWAT